MINRRFVRLDLIEQPVADAYHVVDIALPLLALILQAFPVLEMCE